MGQDLIFVGIKGSVVALDRATGEMRWQTPLRGSDFVNVTHQNGDVFAASRGRLYRLDSATGQVQWCNELPGFGYGIASIAGASQTPPAAEKKRRDDEAATGVAVAGAASHSG
jgi:outer membrane protein assembly factor BamB